MVHNDKRGPLLKLTTSTKQRKIKFKKMELMYDFRKFTEGRELQQFYVVAMRETMSK